LFEQNLANVTTLSRQQLNVMKSSLGTVNNMLTDIEFNEKLIKEGIMKINYMHTLGTELRTKFNASNTKVKIEGHILRTSNAMTAIWSNIDVLINSVVNAQKGIVQPQIISPKDLVDNLVKSSPAFPEDTTLPFHLSKDSTHLICRIFNL
jgi:hypothetical protein